MVVRKVLVVIIIVIVLVAVLIGAGYILFTQTPPPTGAAPTVTSTSPTYAATGVAINTKILVTFSKAMNPTTISASTFLLKRGTTAVAGTVTYTGVTATFVPSGNLAVSAAHTATITTGAKDAAGHALAVNYVWGFTTGTIADTTFPVVVSTSPVVAVAVNSNISATFSEAMDPATITASTFLLRLGATPVSGGVSYAGLTAGLDPASDLAANTTYTATITSGVRDLAGNPMQSNFVWSFTTSTSSSACGQLTVVLLTAGNFAVLAGSTVTNTGSSTVTGDVGVSPGTAIVGFPPGNIIGSTHGGDAVAAQAQLDLTTAYNDAAGRTLCPVSVAGNLGGQTLTPGLYKSTSGLEISSGDLTLDALGNASAVFIFQIASTLDVSPGMHVILAGGAQAANIFWQVGTSATLGTGSTFIGTIMSDQAVSLSTGATLNGRALARIAAVTLDAAVVTKP